MCYTVFSKLRYVPEEISCLNTLRITHFNKNYFVKKATPKNFDQNFEKIFLQRSNVTMEFDGSVRGWKNRLTGGYVGG